ncbi:MAG: hypothetical protein HY791_06185 [Deltaproteobacteria bacterium]|nr:hypothetical protein [Deltaproteobacteria bacterium]
MLDSPRISIYPDRLTLALQPAPDGYVAVSIEGSTRLRVVFSGGNDTVALPAIDRIVTALRTYERISVVVFGRETPLERALVGIGDFRSVTMGCVESERESEGCRILRGS